MLEMQFMKHKKKDKTPPVEFQLLLFVGRTVPISKEDCISLHFVMEKAMQCNNWNIIMYRLITWLIIDTYLLKNGNLTFTMMQIPYPDNPSNR
jgi:hypothetical protein